MKAQLNRNLNWNEGNTKIKICKWVQRITPEPGWRERTHPAALAAGQRGRPGCKRSRVRSDAQLPLGSRVRSNAQLIFTNTYSLGKFYNDYYYVSNPSFLTAQLHYLLLDIIWAISITIYCISINDQVLDTFIMKKKKNSIATMKTHLFRS